MGFIARMTRSAMLEVPQRNFIRTAGSTGLLWPVIAAQPRFSDDPAHLLFVAVLYLFVNLAVDLLYGVIDPRVRQE
jgi:ABC-type dipeptide/oligopeptide/nickel transport system permease component